MRFIKYIFLIVIFFSLAWINSGFAQQMQVSPTDIDDPVFDHIKVIGQDEYGYYILMSNISLNTSSDRIGFKNRKYKIAYFTKALAQKWSKPVIAQVDDADIDAVTFFNGKILVVSSLYSGSQSKVSYYISRIDNEGNVTGDKNEIASFSPVKSDYAKSEFVISSGRNVFGIVMREFPNDDTQRAFVAILDTSLKLLDQKSTLINHPEKTFEFSNFALSDAGDFVILGINSEKIKALSSKRKTDYYLYTAQKGSSTFKENKIPAEKSITGASIEYDNINNKVVLAGFYAEKDSYIGAGVFYSTIDLASGDEIKLKTASIDGQQNIRLKGERNAGSGYSIIGYPIERIVLRNDGGAVLVAEAAYTTEYSYYDYFTQSFNHRLEYHFDNVVILSVNKDATVDWSAVVEKNQVSLDDGGVFSSFSPLLNSEQLILIFNDNISKHNNIIPVTVNNKGVLTRGKEIKSTDGLLLLPRSGKQVAENMILVPVYRKRKLFLALFTF